MSEKEIVYADFMRGVHHPKIGWIMDQLAPLGIPTRIHGESINGPVLQIAQGYFELAMSVINREIGQFNVGLDNRSITISDLPDNHAFFHKSDPLTLSAPIEVVPERVEIPSTPPALTIVPPTTGKVPVDVPKKDMETQAGAFVDKKTKPRIHGQKPDGAVLATSTSHVPVDDDSIWDDGDWGEEEVSAEWANYEELEAKAKTILKWSTQMILNEPNKSSMVDIFEINSSHMSTIGATVFPSATDHMIIYCGFKGGATNYRYHPVSQQVWCELLEDAIKTANGQSPEASVGEVFWDCLRKPAEEGKIVAERYEDEGKWVKIPTKAQRQAERKARVNPHGV